MIPYSEISYFLFLTAVAIPAVILGIKEKRGRPYLLIATLLTVVFTYLSTGREFRVLIIYYLIQWGILWLYRKVKEKDCCEIAYFTAIIVSILPLIAVKVIPFINKFSHADMSNIGFLGISYLTFRNVQLIVESHDKLIKKITFLDFTCFLLFFPTISSGPIDRSRRFIADLHGIPSKQEYLELLEQGINKIFMGLLYKYILGYLVNIYWLVPLQNAPKTLLNTWGYMYAYSAYLFFDFAGYSLFAIGFSYIFRIRTPENFNYPFISRNIKDFWNRWHMSLSFWFRDYVFMRIIFWLTKRKIFTSKKTPMVVGYLALFGLMGLWHGITGHYFAYGMYHAALMIGYDIFSAARGKKSLITNPWINRICSIFVTFHAICFGFLIFSGRLF